MEFKEFKKIAKETILFILATTKLKVDELREKGDISGAEILEKEVILKYERVFTGIDKEEFQIFFEENPESAKKIFNELAEKNGISQESIRERMAKRNLLGEKSGAVAVEKLFRHELSQLKSAKNRLLEKADMLLKEEYRLNSKLSEAIQYEEQEEIINELTPIRRKFVETEEKLKSIELRKKEISEKLLKKWYYEIYGTVPEEELKEIFKDYYRKAEDEKND